MSSQLTVADQYLKAFEPRISSFSSSFFWKCWSRWFLHVGNSVSLHYSVSKFKYNGHHVCPEYTTELTGLC